MAVKERSQIKGTDAQIKAFAGHNGVLAFATDTKSLHVLSGTAGTTTEFLPSSKVATKTELGSYATSEELTTELAKKANTADVTASFAKYTPTASLAQVATSGSYNDLSDKPVVDSELSPTSTNAVQNKVIQSALDSKLDIKKSTAGELLLNFGQGGWLTLLGEDYNREDKGGFILGTTGPNFAGRPDGTLTWGGRKVLTGNPARLTVVAESYSDNSWYRKYSDGWIEQGGIFSCSTVPSENNRVNLAIPFSTAVYLYAIGGPASATGSYNTGGDSETTDYTTVSFAGVNKTQVLFSVSQRNNKANATLSIPVVAWGK